MAVQLYDQDAGGFRIGGSPEDVAELVAFVEELLSSEVLHPETAPELVGEADRVLRPFRS